jgi:Flp pilus assembly protein TadG
MLRRFFGDESGNYMLLTAAAIVPIMGGLAVAVDYSEMSSQRQETLNALDAAGIATARFMVSGTVTDDATKAYAKSFFEANLGSVKPADTLLTVVLPQNNAGGGTLKLTAGLKYKPYFFPTFAWMIGKGGTGSTDLDFAATSEVRLKNTLEVALVLDNSGSMAYIGTGSGKKRIDLLKEASKQLVDTIAGQAALMKQISKPVQFALVPFSASVNIGPDKSTATWMDQDGLSPIHHEYFDWTTFTASNKKVVKDAAGFYYKKGTGWGAEANQKVTRFTLYSRDILRVTNSSGTKAPYASWAGCVEARPSPYNTNDAAPSTATPATLFVPMFGPDEPGDVWNTSPSTTFNTYSASNNWWNDVSEDGTTSYGTIRQKYMPKYFTVAPYGATNAATGEEGPNASCTTKPITVLTDVSTTAGQTAIKASIDAMSPTGATNVPEGMAWGWRVLSSGVPFTEGRLDTEKGNDKVVIVLTDGQNTYYTPSSLGFSDPANDKSTYSAYGYAGKWNSAVYATSRIFLGTSSNVSKTDYSNANYTKAMNEQFKTLCDNAKATGVLVMTVSLDLNSGDTTEKAQMDALKACSSDSRFRKDPTTGLAAKLYWNATGGNLADKFKEIADELSNLRIVG